MCVLVLACCMPPIAAAQQWQFEPRIRATGEYNDNARLREGDQGELVTAGAVLDLRGRFVRRAPSSLVRVDPRIRTSQYPGDESEEADDFFVDIYGEKSTEKLRYGLSTRISEEAVRTAEIDDPDFADPDVGDPISNDGGRINVRDDRERIVFAPFLDYKLSEKTTLGISADYIDVDYGRNTNGNLDYDSFEVSTELEYGLSEMTTAGFNVFASQYEANNIFQESDSIGAGVSLRRNISQTIQAGITVGFVKVDSEDLDQNDQRISSSDNSALFGASLTRRGEISRLVADIRQSVDPGSSGEVQKRAQFRLRYSRSLTPTISGEIETRLQQVEQVSGLSGQLDRDFYRVQFGLNWRLSRVWSLSGRYSFTNQDFSDRPGDATANAISVGIVYEPKRRR